jgi:hypothetical protein
MICRDHQLDQIDKMDDKGDVIEDCPYCELDLLRQKMLKYERALCRISNKEPNPMNSTAAWCIYHARETLEK